MLNLHLTERDEIVRLTVALFVGFAENSWYKMDRIFIGCDIFFDQLAVRMSISDAITYVIFCSFHCRFVSCLFDDVGFVEKTD